jgi:hypothetical protein
MKLERLRKGIADMKEQLATTNEETIGGSNLDEEKITQQSSSPITERFILLRKRLLPLYSEPVSTKPDERSNTTHPLFNMSSPQFQALNWLANIDKTQIMDDDPHLQMLIMTPISPLRDAVDRGAILQTFLHPIMNASGRAP